MQETILIESLNNLNIPVFNWKAEIQEELQMVQLVFMLLQVREMLDHKEDLKVWKIFLELVLT